MILSATQELNKLFDKQVDDPEIAARISQYRWRLHTIERARVDGPHETKETLGLYGTKGGDEAASELPARRRLAERGVRLSALPPRWDSRQREGRYPRRGENRSGHDRPAEDLKRRGMGRHADRWGASRPHADGARTGRDHHMWASRSGWRRGIKGGMTYGNTDEFGYNAVENVVTCDHDDAAPARRRSRAADNPLPGAD